jgi:alkylation response protein AidB-like acyl-CoA dehydrogenase
LSIAVTPEHEQLATSVRRWTERHAPPEVARATYEADDRTGRPEFWPALAEQGLLGLHLDEEFGGSGAGMVELAVVCEQLGRALVPGPIVPTMLGSVLVQRVGARALAKELLPKVADGRVTMAVSLDADDLTATATEEGWVLSGAAPIVLAGAAADQLVLGARGKDGDIWLVVDADVLEVVSRDSLDRTRPVASLTANDVPVGFERVLEGLDTATVRDLAVALLTAEAAGVAGWCLDEATAYARTREQFGVPIGEFQAIKHRCADMLVRVEESAALAWDAAVAAVDDDQRPLASAVAAAVGPEAAVINAKDCVQIHGGMGYTWEHDAHLYLRRATTLRQLVGHPATWQTKVAALAAQGARRVLALEVGDAGGTRDAIRGLVEQAAALDGHEQRVFLADHGFLAPHWPRPWGRAADAHEQLIIQQELRRAEVKPPPLVMGDWVLPTLIAHGSDEQRDRFMMPSLYGELTWCQMFSEPGAGSDLASLSTRAERVDGGWLVNGQKVWTSIAQFSDWAICLVRTNPAAPKHAGITYLLVDMKSDGIDIRPLKEMTGHEMFNEVHLDDVFVPDECVVGEVDHGWHYARTTLDNERVAIAEGPVLDSILEDLVALAGRTGQDALPHVQERLGALLCESSALAILGLRSTARTLAGLSSASTASVRKLVSAHHKQDVAELGLQLLGAEGATTEADAARWSFQFLLMRSFTIFGGTSEIQRNVIGERILSLPRDRRTGDTGRDREDLA